MLDKKQLLSKKSLIDFLSPSELGAVFCVVASLATGIIAIFINRFRPATLSLSSSDFSKNISIANSHLNGTILANDLIKDVAPIFLSLVIAAVIYLLAYDIYQAIQLDKTPKSSARLLFRKVGLNFLLRMIVLAVWLPYLSVFFRSVIPYTIRIALLTTTASNVLLVASYVIISVVIASVASHLNIVLCRLFFLKPRLFKF